MSHCKCIFGIRLRALLWAMMLSCILPLDCALAAVSPLPNTQGIPSTPQVGQQLAQAQKAIEDGNLRLALIILKSAVRKAPADGVARMHLGLAYLRVADFPAAERELREARKDGAPDALVLAPLFQVMFARDESLALLSQFLDPPKGSETAATPDILSARAIALARSKRTAEAMDAMDRSLQLRRDAPALLNKARLLLQSGDRKGADRFADEAVQSSANTPDALMFKAELLLASGNKLAAQKLADQLGAKFPNDVSSQLGRTEIFLSLKQDDLAGAEIEKVLAKNPGLAKGMYYKALLMARKGDKKGAWIITQSLPREMLDASPATAEMVATIAENAGHIDTAATTLNRIIMAHPDLASIRMRLATLRLRQGDPRSALGVLEPIKNSFDPEVVALRSRIQQELDHSGNHAGRLTAFDKAGPDNRPAPKDTSTPDITPLATAANENPTDPEFVVPYLKALVERQRYSEALSATDRLSSNPSQRANALVYRGNILLLQNDAAGTRRAFDRAVQIEPHNKTALRARASLLLAAQRNAEAEADFHRILSLDPKDMTALLGLAETAVRKGDTKNAKRILAKAIKLWPDSDPPRIALIRQLMNQKDLESALKSAEDLVRLHPQNPDGVALQGQVETMLGLKKEAASSFRRLVALSPTVGEPQAQLARALFAMGDHAGATSAMNAAVKLEPASLKLVSDQISLQLTLGGRSAAVASARSYRQLRPGIGADILMADTLVRVGRTDQATKLLGDSFSQKPNSVLLQRLMAIPTQPAEAQRTRDLAAKWLRSHPDDTGVHLEYGTLLMQAGETSKAIEQYEIVLKQDPRNFAAMNNLAWLIQDSDPKRAIAMLTLAANLSHDAPDILDTLGWIKIQHKDVTGGLKLLRKAHALQPQNGDTTYHLVVALDASSDRETARQLLGSLLASNISFSHLAAARGLSAAWH